MQNFRELAEHYQRRFGFEVLPMRGKAPLVTWRQYIDKQIDQQVLENFSWNSGTDGLAVILGKNDLHALDIDNITDPELLKKLLYDLGLPAEYSWNIRSGSCAGNHIYFYAGDDSQLTALPGGQKTVYALKPKNSGSCDHIEIRWKGCLLILPHSRHKSGNYYEFVNTRENRLPESAPREIKVSNLLKALRNQFILPDENKEEPKTTGTSGNSYQNSDLTRQQQDNLQRATEMMAGKIDNYEDWMRLGFALASLGEDGRPYFELLSQNNPKYTDTPHTINSKFDEFVGGYKGKITLGTYFEIAKRYGFIYQHSEFWFLNGDKVKILPDRLIELLAGNGFAKMVLGKECIYIRTENRILNEILIIEIKDFVMAYIENIAPGKNKSAIKRAVIRQAASLFSSAQLEFLPTIKPLFQRDLKDKAYFYFRNVFVEAGTNGLNAHNYSELSRYIWRGQLIDHEIRISNTVSEFARVIENVCDQDANRINALKSAIGYLLHGYKDPSVTKAVIFTDEKLSDDAFGRSGKGLIVHALMKLKSTLKLDMQNHSMDKAFPFQSVNPDTQLIWMDEVSKRFPFQRMFSMLAEGLTIEKKNKNEFFIPYEDSPKFVITSNFSISGKDDSSLDRQFVIEFSDHYNKNHKPVDEFGHLFFADWDETEWNAFYMLMMECCRIYLQYGLQRYNHVNLKMKNLIDETCSEFADFMTDLSFGCEYNRKDIYEEFLNEYEDFKTTGKLRQNTFTRWIKYYCQIYDYVLVERKSNKQYYFIILKKEQEISEQESELTGMNEEDTFQGNGTFQF